MLAEYKSNRAKAPPGFGADLRNLQHVLRAMRVCTVSAPGFEADDVLAGVAQQASREGYTVRVYSSDMDLYQVCVRWWWGRGKLKDKGWHVSNCSWWHQCSQLAEASTGVLPCLTEQLLDPLSLPSLLTAPCSTTGALYQVFMQLTCTVL